MTCTRLLQAIASTALILSTGHPVAAAPQSSRVAASDIFDKGIVFNGPVTFERKKDMTQFSVKDTGHDSFALIRLLNEHADSETRTLSSAWLRQLVQARTMTLRVAHVNRQLKPGDSLPDGADDYAICKPLALERTSENSWFALRCVAFVHELRVMKNANMIYEFDIAVRVPSGSSENGFLASAVTARDDDELVYARLEP